MQLLQLESSSSRRHPLLHALQVPEPKVDPVNLMRLEQLHLERFLSVPNLTSAPQDTNTCTERATP